MNKFKDLYSIGQKIRLKRIVDRLPHFIVIKGVTGKVFLVNDDQLWIKMDEIIEGAELWENCIVWNIERIICFDSSEAENDIQILPQN